MSLGWIGSIMLALCGLPQAIQCLKNKNANGLDPYFLALWTGGEVFTLIAVLKDVSLPYLLFNYGCNLVFLSIIWWYKVKK